VGRWIKGNLKMRTVEVKGARLRWTVVTLGGGRM